MLHCVGLLLGCCASVTALELGFWSAANKTAQSIAGEAAI
jgi:hypothetical protein